MPNQFLSDQFGDIEDYFLTDYELIDQYIGDTLWIWGNNSSGQLGINNTVTRSTPVTTFAGGNNWKSAASGNSHTSAIKTDGTLWTWGTNTNGQLGIGLGASRATPVTTLLGGNNWKFISCGQFYTAAIKTDGTLWIWGQNTSGQLGNNTITQRSTPVTTFLGGNNWKSVACSGSHTVALKTDGTLWTWGSNYAGKLGINEPTGVSKSTPVTTFLGGNNWKSVACGGSHTVAIKTDGTLWTWGSNVSSQLGTNNLISRSTPVTTFLGGNNWKSVACGYSHNAAIKTDGTLWTWGVNGDGQLGINVQASTSGRSTPVTTFLGGNNWKSVACGGYRISAIKTDGTLWTWGRNDSGQLGTNNLITRSTPVTTFLGGNNWKSISSGGSTGHIMALTAGTSVDFR